MNVTENRIYFYRLRELNEEKEGVVDESFTKIINKVLNIIHAGLADQLMDKLSELDENARKNNINLINRDY